MIRPFTIGFSFWPDYVIDFCPPQFHTSTIGTGGVGPNPDKSGKLCHSPIIKFSSMLVRPVATGEEEAEGSLKSLTPLREWFMK